MPGRRGLSEPQLATRWLCFQEQTLSLLCEEQRSVLSDYSLDHRWLHPSLGDVCVRDIPRTSLPLFKQKPEDTVMNPGNSVKAGSCQPRALPAWSPGVFPHLTKHKPLLLWVTWSWYLHRWQLELIRKLIYVKAQLWVGLPEPTWYKEVHSSSCHLTHGKHLREQEENCHRRLSWASTARTWSLAQFLRV